MTSGECIHGWRLDSSAGCPECEKEALARERARSNPEKEPLTIDVAFAQWVSYGRRAAMYSPMPASYSRPIAEEGAVYEDPDKVGWQIVEDELLSRGAGRAAHQMGHSLRRLLLWVHRDGGLPEDFVWPALMGVGYAEQTYILGMRPQHRARGDYEAFRKSIRILLRIAPTR